MQLGGERGRALRRGSKCCVCVCLFFSVSEVSRAEWRSTAEKGGGGWKGAELTGALSLVGCHRVPPVSTATRFQPQAPPVQCNTNTKKKQPDSSADVQLVAGQRRDVGFFVFCFLFTNGDKGKEQHTSYCDGVFVFSLKSDFYFPYSLVTMFQLSPVFTTISQQHALELLCFC